METTGEKGGYPGSLMDAYILPINSDPTSEDGDGDELGDFEDYYPLSEKYTNICLYDCNILGDGLHMSSEDEAKKLIDAAPNFEKGVIISFTSAGEFKIKWNSMDSAPNNKKYLIDFVYVISHGNPMGLDFEDLSKLFADPIYSYHKEGTNYISVTDLADIKIKNLVFASCNAGNMDFIKDESKSKFISFTKFDDFFSKENKMTGKYETEFLNNLSVSYLSTHENVTNVYGADGYVQYVVNSLTVRRASNDWSTDILYAGIDQWSMQRNGTTRTIKNWVKYYKDDGAIKYCADIKWNEIK